MANECLKDICLDSVDGLRSLVGCWTSVPGMRDMRCRLLPTGWNATFHGFRKLITHPHLSTSVV